MADCGDLLTNQDLENAKQNATTYKVVIESDLPTTTTPDGKTIFTLVGLNQQISFIYPPILWEPGLVVDNALQLYEVPPSVSGDTGSFLVFPFVENLPFTTGAIYDPSKWTVLQYSKENLDQAVSDAEAQAQAAAASASQSAASAQTASNEADRAEQAVIDAAVAGGIYETVLDGQNAVNVGDLFLVVASEPSGFADLYKKTGASTSVFQGKTTLDTMAVQIARVTYGHTKVKNLLSKNAINDFYNQPFSGATTIEDAIDINPDDDAVLNTLGVKQRIEVTGRTIFTGRQEIAATNNQYVVYGHVVYGAEPITSALRLSNSNQDGSTLTVTPIDFGREQLGSNLWVIWRTAQIGTDATDPRLGMFMDTNGDPNWSAASPFVGVSDGPINWFDVDIFNLSDNENGFIYDSIREINNTTFTNTSFVWPDSTDRKEDDETIKHYIPDGYGLYDDTGLLQQTFNPRVNFGASHLNEYWSVTFYIRGDGLTKPTFGIFEFDGTNLVNQNSSKSSRIIELVEPGVWRVNISGQFLNTMPEYGIRFNSALGAGSTGNIGYFGLTASVGPDRIINRDVEPVSWESPNSKANGNALYENPFNNYKRKKMIWMGTSVPNARSYPDRVAAELDCDLIKITKSGGHLNGFFHDGSFVSSSLVPFYFTLTNQEVDDRYQPNIGQEVDPTDYFILQPGSGFTLTQNDIDALKPDLHEDALLSIASDIDYFIVDYGINDRRTGGDILYPWPLARDSGQDRSTFAGSMTYLFNKIYDIKQGQGEPLYMVIITNYWNGAYQSQDEALHLSQLDCGQYLACPVIDITKVTGVNDITFTDLIPDSVHPVINGPVDIKYARTIANQLRLY